MKIETVLSNINDLRNYTWRFKCNKAILPSLIIYINGDIFTQKDGLNFLAHFYLVRESKELIVGNMLADFVRGKQYLELPKPFQAGVLIHRKIDSYTDSHPETDKTKSRLREKYRKYAPVISDVFYDYILGKNWSDYSTIPLAEFSQNIYQTLFDHIQELPDEAKMMLSYMSKNDWLLHYSTYFGIEKALQGLSRRTKFDTNMHEAVTDLKSDLPQIEEEFQSFFPELISFVEHEKTKL